MIMSEIETKIENIDQIKGIGQVLVLIRYSGY